MTGNAFSKGTAVIGATGAVGRAALWVCETYADRFPVVALAAQSNAEAMEQLAVKFRPKLAALTEPEAGRRLSEKLFGTGVSVASGSNALLDVVRHPEVEHVVFASSGTKAIPALQETLRLRKEVSLANKESIVVAGPWVMPLIAHPLQLRPVDSEHNAVWQALMGEMEQEREKTVLSARIDRVYLTASGGPFRSFSSEELRRVTPEMALKHPVWTMGSKITIDSATLMNKGIELLEAMSLFDLDATQVSALIHPGSKAHALVRFRDGCSKMLLSAPDMRIPAAVAMSWPVRLPLTKETALPHFDIEDSFELRFEPPDTKRFPCLALAQETARRGGAFPALLVGADEIAVEAFLAHRIAFPDIADVVERVLDSWSDGTPSSLEDALSVLQEGRRRAAAATGLPIDQGGAYP